MLKLENRIYLRPEILKLVRRSNTTLHHDIVAGNIPAGHPDRAGKAHAYTCEQAREVIHFYWGSEFPVNICDTPLEGTKRKGAVQEAAA